MIELSYHYITKYQYYTDVMYNIRLFGFIFP